MGLLLLLTYTLLSSYVLSGKVVDAQRKFTIRSIVLSMEPSTNVTRGTDVFVRCKATISSLQHEVLSREYTMYKNNKKVYTKTTTSEDLLYPLPDVRVSNTGKYMCKINIGGKQMESNAEKLTVTGLSQPVLHLKNSVVTEGEEVTAQCTAPNETGSIFFYFYEGSNVIKENESSSNKLEATLSFSTTGIHRIYCTYIVSVMPDSFKSEESSTVVVSVRELPIMPVMEINPDSNIYEGDRLSILCTVRNQGPSFKNVNIYLSQGTQLLSSGITYINHTMTALASDPGDFECRLEMQGVEKVASKKISVTELFTVPILTMSPAEVFQKDDMTLTCKSESKRLNSQELTYSLEPSYLLTQMSSGVFSGRAQQSDYTCVAQAKGILKHSETLTVRPKVSVSTPEISLVDSAVLGKPINITCKSATGSLPINYTLLKNATPVTTITVELPSQKAIFTVTVTRPDEINNYICQANNRHKDSQHSKRLNGTVIVPLTKPTLITHPELSEIYEESELLLLCRITGTPPVTYNWYRNGNKLKTNTSNQISMDYHVQSLNKDDSGIYFCEAVNQANTVQSDRVTIEVYMARWKRALIVGVIVLVAIALLVVVVVMCVLHFKSKRVKMDRAAVSVWTERPPDAASDEVSSMVSNEPDVEYTEVVHPQPADPDRVLLRKGTDTVYSELKNSPHGAADHHDYGSLEYAEPNGERPDISHYSPEVNNYQDLPVPVD